MAQSDEGLIAKQYLINSQDGTEISVWRIAARNNTSTNSQAVIHAHGGGFIIRKLDMNTVDLSRFCLKPMGQDWLQRSGVVLLYVAYRIATEKPFPAPADEVYFALKWASDEVNAKELGINRENIGLMGFSAGGNLALAAALRARDDRLTPPVCGLMLIYPMLDPDTQWENSDRCDLSKETKEKVAKDKAFLREGWYTYLEKPNNPSDNRKYTRLLLLDCHELPPTYIDVGTSDYFLDECRQLIKNLIAAGVQVTAAEWEGMPHAFEAEKQPSEVHESTVRAARQKRELFWQTLLADPSTQLMSSEIS